MRRHCQTNTAPMDRFTVRLPADLARRFDAAAGRQGGRSRLLRRLIEGASDAAVPEGLPAAPAGVGAKLTLRLRTSDLAALEAEADRCGLSRTRWTTALIRRRLHDRPQPAPAEAQALIEARRELRRIGVNINQIARALNTAVLEGVVLRVELIQLAAFADEIRGYSGAIDEALRANLDYWDAS